MPSTRLRRPRPAFCGICRTLTRILSNAIGDGDRWLFFLTEPEAVTVPVAANPGTATASAPDASLTAVPTLDPVAVELTAVADAPAATLTAVPTLDPVAADPGTAEAGTPQASLSATVASATPVAASPGETTAEAPAASLSATVQAGALTLANIAIPQGRALVGQATLITVGASGDVYNTSDATVEDGADPPNLGSATLNATRIFVTANPQLRISEDGAGNIETIFSTGGAQENYRFHVQTSLTDVLTYGSGDIHAGRSTGARLLLGADGDPDGLLGVITPVARVGGQLASGDRLIWFLTEPDTSNVVTADPGETAAARSRCRTYRHAGNGPWLQ